MYLCPPDSRSVLCPLWIVTWKHGCSCMALCMCPSQLISVSTPCLECVHESVHVFMSTWLPMLAKLPMGSYMEPGFLYESLCVCPSHPSCGPTPWLKYVNASVHVYMSTWLTMSVSPLLNSYMETWVLLYGTVVVSHRPHLCSHTLVRICMCISTCIHVHLTSYVCSTHQSEVEAQIRGGRSDCRWELQLKVRPLIRSGSSNWRWELWSEVGASIGGETSNWWWDLQLVLPPPIGGPTCDWRSHLWLELSPLIGGPTSNERSHLQLELPSLIGFGHTPWWECVNASVHEFMSTWLPMSAPLLMHSLKETWVPLCGIMCLSHSPYFWTHTLVRMCTCISTCIYVHPTPHVSSTPYG